MCGIAGITFFSRLYDWDDLEKRIYRMVDRLRHRGPDDMGIQKVSNKPQTIFGHTRLSIIDLSSAGHQPMSDNTSGNWITFNGEIYNFRELRAELENEGEIFNSHTDTEVILKAYNHWGINCIEKLEGMFAFALWDESNHMLLLVRDRIGIKPLYIYRDQEKLLFASEVRALLHSDLINKTLEPKGLCSYLSYGSVQEPYTLVKNVFSLRPAQFMTVKNGIVRTQCYWKPNLSEQCCDKDIKERVAELVTDAVKKRMIADVPLGAFLSGGIDSTAVVATMRRISNTPAKTFSMVFNNGIKDERKYSRLAAERLGTEHQELELSGNEVRSNLRKALNDFDQPSVDGLNTWYISKITKQANLTVALSGLGGDELFIGYSGFSKALSMQRWGQKLQLMPRSMGVFLEKHAKSERTRKMGEAISFPQNMYFLSRQLYSERQQNNMLNPEISNMAGKWLPQWYCQLIDETAKLDEINRVSWLELNTYMLSTLLRDTDQMSLAHALEVRVPLIDHKLVELLFTIPGKQKLDSSIPKPLLVASTGNRIPKECIFRPKQGFTLPFDQWFADELKNDIESFFLSPSSNSEFFSHKGLSDIWTAYKRKTVSWSRIWAIFVVYSWLRTNNINL